jgi:hypothetical protein
MKCCLSILAILTAFAASTALAQWHSDSTTNTAVCTASNIQEYPQAIPDGHNGAIIVWQDHRSNANWQVYAQHLDSNGYATWGTNGIPVCRKVSSDHDLPILCGDNNGGAYVAWIDDRMPANGLDIYAQHVEANGSLAWDTAGVAVVATNGDQNNMSITADSAGNAYIAWEDNRSTISSTSRPDIYMNYLTPAGVQWSATGKAIISLASKQRHPKLCDDGAGGCLLTFENSAVIPQSICASRINSFGTVEWGYLAQGTTVYKGGSYLNLASDVDVHRDGNQFVIAWEVTNASTSYGQDIWANRLNMDSTTLWYAGNPGPVATNYPGNQTHPIVFSDDSIGDYTNAGLFVIFGSDYINTSVEMRRVLQNGSDVLPPGNTLEDVCSISAGSQTGAAAVKVGPGKVLVVWNDSRLGTTDSSIWAQVIDKTPQRCLPTVGTSSEWGRPISVSTSYQSKQVTLVPRANGAIAVWMDTRNLPTTGADIYAQLIFPDGSLPIELSAFGVTSNTGRVDLSWTTAQEKDDAGFEIQRRSVSTTDQTFETIQSYTTNPALRGHGQSSSAENYFAIDYPGASGTYEYRLVDVSLDGIRTEHAAKQVEVNLSGVSNGWSLAQSMPNPSSDRATIAFTTASSAVVDLVVTDVLGRIVSQPIQHQVFAAGGHSVSLDANTLQHGMSSGTYLYRMTAYDPATGATLWTNNKAMTMQIVR